MEIHCLLGILPLPLAPPTCKGINQAHLEINIHSVYPSYQGLYDYLQGIFNICLWICFWVHPCPLSTVFDRITVTEACVFQESENYQWPASSINCRMAAQCWSFVSLPSAWSLCVFYHFLILCQKEGYFSIVLVVDNPQHGSQGSPPPEVHAFMSARAPECSWLGFLIHF